MALPTQNDFLVWAGGSNANVLTQAQYVALPNESSGVVSGKASAQQANKTWRQTSIMSSMIAKFIVDAINQPVIDDGTVQVIENNFVAAIRSIFVIPNTGVVPGTYGPTSSIAVEADGRITSLSNQPLGNTGVIPGTYAAPTLTVQADGRITAASAANIALNAVPIGFMAMYGGSVAPRYYLICDGSAISRTTYSALFGQIGTNFGVGNGSTTFNLPDMRGRVPAGPDAGTGRLTVFTAGLGASGGHQLVQAHNHGISDPGHSHPIYDPSHVHGVGDPGHAHGVSDPSHVHGVGDPGHAHGVSDPGHRHTIMADNSSWLYGYNTATGPVQGPSGSDFDQYGGWSSTDVTGIGIQGAGTGIYLGYSGTGIGINGGYTGIYLGYAGTGVQTYAVGTGVTTQNAGGGNQQNVQPTQVVNFIIFAGV